MDANIISISYYVPKDILSNEDIAKKHPEWSIEKIASKTGIYTRHITAKDEFASDMAFNAATRLFEECNIDKSKIDFIILCTQSPDYFLPTTACILQDRLKLSKKCGAFDFNLGCSGYVYGLGIAKGLLHSSQAKNILLLTSETYSKFIHPEDKSNKTLFGDGATATLLSTDPINTDFQNILPGKIGNFEYSTDGAGYEYLIVKNGGIKYKDHTSESIYEDNNFVRNDNNLYMDGKEIFNFTSFSVPTLINTTLEKNQLALNDIDLFVFHQANEFMLNTIRKRIGIPTEKFYICLKDFGNTVSSTIPIALNHAIQEGKIQSGNKVLIAGFGVGLSMGATVLYF